MPQGITTSMKKLVHIWQHVTMLQQTWLTILESLAAPACSVAID